MLQIEDFELGVDLGVFNNASSNAVVHFFLTSSEMKLWSVYFAVRYTVWQGVFLGLPYVRNFVTYVEFCIRFHETICYYLFDVRM